MDFFQIWYTNKAHSGLPFLKFGDVYAEEVMKDYIAKNGSKTLVVPTS